MKWFNNLRMGVKLLGAFLALVLLVGGVLGGLGYFNLNSVNNIIKEIVNQRVPSVKNATAVERYALRTILDEKQYLLGANDTRVDRTQFQASAMKNIDQIIAALDEVDKVAKEYNDTDLLAKSQEVRTVTLQYKDLYNQGVAALEENAQLATVMADNGTKVTDLAHAFFNDKTGLTDEETMKQIPILVDIWETALITRIDQNKYMLYRDQKYYTALEDNIKKLGVRYTDLERVSTQAADKQKINEARTATDAYYAAAQGWVAKDNELTAILADMNSIGLKVQENAMAAEDAGWLAAEATKDTSASAVSSAITLTIIAVVVAILLGLILGIVISNSIANPLAFLTKLAKALSVGDMVRDVSEAEKDTVRKRKDEIGDISNAFDALINYMQGMGAAATAIAENNLTTSITPKSPKDELGNSFAKMIAGLRDAVSQIAEGANSVSIAASQLTTAAEQSGEATSQIATTIQQVALGTAQQTEGVTKTSASVE